MGTVESTAYCPQCEDQVRITRQTPNHLLHLVLSVVTMGLWVIVWAMLAMEKRPWRCSACGADLGGGSGGWGLVGAAFAKRPQQEGPAKRRCPFCRELVRHDAKLCKHCGQRLEPEEITIG